MIVELRETSEEYSELTPGQPYAVFGIEADDYRILNDHGSPYLYPRDLFVVVDAKEPDDWVQEVGEDRERYAYPPPLDQVGFFEDFFDGKVEAVASFWQVMNRRLSTAA